MNLAMFFAALCAVAVMTRVENLATPMMNFFFTLLSVISGFASIALMIGAAVNSIKESIGK